MEINYSIYVVKSEHLETNEAIFQKVTEIIKFSDVDIVPIIFSSDPDIKFINPLFFTLLLSEKRQTNIRYAIDITQLSDFVQASVQHFLRQMIDLKQINIEINSSEYKNVLEEKNLLEKAKLYISLGIPKDSLFLTKDATEESITFEKNKKYHYLPIMNLRKLPDLFQRGEYEEIGNNSSDPKEKRKMYYSRVFLHKNNIKDLSEYQKFLKLTINEFLSFLDLDLYNLYEPLGSIFYELIDNIRKHTTNETDGFFSFFRHEVGAGENKYYEYQLIVCDNGTEGFLNKYQNELYKELYKLCKAKIDKKLLKNYIKTIQGLKTKDPEIEKTILKDMFYLKKITQTHQISRVAMHFGIPMLLKMMETFIDKKRNKNLLEVYTHRDNRYYKVAYDSRGNYIEPKLQNHGIKGTYIVLTFSDRIQPYVSPTDSKRINSLITNQDYAFIFEEKKDIEKKVKTFQSITINKVKELTDLGSVDGNIIIDANNIAKETFGEFIRALYLYAYKNYIKDIVVTNVDFKEFVHHFRLLAQIMYENDDTDYELPRNILFYNKYFPSSIFIGGRSKKEFLTVANSLTSYYGVDASLGLAISNKKEEDKKQKKDNEISIDSVLLRKKSEEVGERFLLPFELFTFKDKELADIDLLEKMIENYLNDIDKNKKNIHLDTGYGYHINRFLEFKKTFEDSRWVRRLAFRLALRLADEKDFTLYGADKYTNMLISLALQYLSSNAKYHLHDIHRRGGFESLKKDIRKDETKKKFLISSLIFEGNGLRILQDNTTQVIPAIQLLLEDKNIKINMPKEIEPLMRIKNRGTTWEISKDEYCGECSGEKVKFEKRNIPLLDLSKEDPFFIQNTFFEGYTSKKIENYSHNVKFFDTLHFGHIERGNNHFLYYSDTVKFFEKNREEIKKFLEKTKEKVSEIVKEKDVLILAPSHDTNNNFIALSNQILFDNEATVLTFDKSRSESNFYDLNSYQFEWGNTAVFFIDDSIASGHTLEYFYQLFQSMYGAMSLPHTGLDGVVIMIDRMSTHDESIISNYIKNDNNLYLTSTEKLKRKLKTIYAFTSFEIKPIKTEVEECFLCKRKEEYLALMKQSALDLNTFQMASKVIKIKNTSHNKLKKPHKLDIRLRTFIKAMAADYIHRKYASDKKEELKNTSGTKPKVDEIIAEFANNMYSQIKDESDFLVYTKDLKNIITFESEIALLKAMSFPKLSYYYNIRQDVIRIIFDKLNNYLPATKIELKENILDIDATEDDFLEHYKSKTNFHKINSYFSILGYFKDSRILDTDYIKLYYHMTQQVIEKKTKGSEIAADILHAYPFAVKITINNNLEKSNYFDNNLVDTRRDENIIQLKKKKYSLFNALFLENSTQAKDLIYKEFEEKNKTTTDEKIKEIFKIQGFQTKIDELKKFLISLFDTKNEDTIKLFISPLMSIESRDYIKYIKDSENELVDVFNNFLNINLEENKQLKNDIKMIFYGAVDKSKEADEDVELDKVSKEEELFTKINDTWANTFSNGYTLVRITDIGIDDLLSDYQKDIFKNNPVWFRPIGVIAIKHAPDEYDHLTHLKKTRTALSIKLEYVVEFLKEEFGYGTIQREIQNKEYESIFSTFNHDVASMFEIDSIIEDIEESYSEQKSKNTLIKLKNYASYMLEITKVGRLKKYQNIDLVSNPISVLKLLSSEQEQAIIYDFFEIYNEYINTEKEINIKIEIDQSCESFYIPLATSYLRILFYELFLNAGKYGCSNNNVVKLYVENQILFLKNKRGEITSKGFQIALDNLNYMLNQVNYELSTNKKSTDEYFVVEIKRMIEK